MRKKISKAKISFVIGILVIIATGFLAMYLMNNYFIENNYSITSGQYAVARTIGQYMWFGQVIIYIIWRLQIDKSIRLGNPKYFFPLVIVMSLVVAYAQIYVVAGIVWQWDALSLKSLMKGMAVCSILETIGMTLACVVFRPGEALMDSRN